MTSENISQPSDLNEATRMIWDQNAAFWDENMAEGNDFQRLLIGPASERLLNLQAGETVLEIACGNGVFSRRMAEINPLMRGIRQVVKSGGRFVFSLTHPCFNHSGMSLCVEEAQLDGELVMTYSVKVTTYLHTRPQKGIAMVGQPTPHYYFDRPLQVLLDACFRAGLVLDGLEEPAFNHPHDSSQSKGLLSWIQNVEIRPFW